MYVISDVFHTKPGKAKELVAKFKDATPYAKSLGAKDVRIMTDMVATYWTVIVEFSVDELNDYFTMNQQRSEVEKMSEAMKGYMDLINNGHREIFKVE